jgi:hypothetical protein
MGPRTRVDANTLCTVATLGLEAIVSDIVVGVTGIEDTISKIVKMQVEQSAGVGDDGLIPVCPTCNVQATHVGGGRIDVYTTPGFDSVRLAVSTTRYTDTTTDPNDMGLIIPPATYAVLASGGTYRSCFAADGTSAAICDGLPLDSQGTFNWWGSDVPVPTPWPMGPNGQYGYIGARDNAWHRLIPLGVTRHAEQLPSPGLEAGSLLARRGGGATNTPGSRLAVQPGCVVPPDSDDLTTAVPTRIAFGVNDLPSVGTEPPTSGALEATVLIPDASASQIVFKGVGRCPAEPTPALRTAGDVTATSATATVSLAN